MARKYGSSTKKYGRRRTARRAYVPARRRRSVRRRNPAGLMTGTPGHWGKLIGAALGAAAASSIPMLEQRPIDAVPISIGGAIGLYLFAFSRGNGGYARWAGLGMVLASIQPAVDEMIAPLTSRLGGGAPNA